MAQTRFGGAHTERKLKVLESYLRAYTTALSSKFHLTYVDAFAGTGEIPKAAVGGLLPDIADADDVMLGSADRASRLTTPFDAYLLIEKNAAKAARLEAHVWQSPVSERCTVVQGDANDAIAKFCAAMDTKRERAVVFLDPYGSQVNWETVASLGQTRAVDLWYLFPAGMSVHRQVSTKGSVHETHEASLDRIFGTAEWRDRFVKTSTENDLFGAADAVEKLVTPESATEFFIERLRTEFNGVVLDSWLPLGRGGAHWYSLVFASANPSEKAIALTKRLATAVMRS